MAKAKTPVKKKDIEQYKHNDKSRPNNPQVGMVSNANDSDSAKKQYSFDPHLDPTLVWAGKEEQSELDVDTVSIHVHERIDPKSIIQQVHKDVKVYQHSLFDQPFDHRPVREEVSFYQHKNAWANRLIAGDSQLVMNSLLEKEGSAGQVQMIYFDPPYGIKYGSNFQPFTNQKEVKDGKDSDLSSEPEMIKAFRDTWELGIHSYLSYIRERLLLSKELLAETGSCFIQISDKNYHHVREICDEIFGAENFVVDIIFTKTGSIEGGEIKPIHNYIIWYSKNKSQMKFRRLFLPRNKNDLASEGFKKYLDADGMPMNISEMDTQKIDLDRVFRDDPITSQGYRETTTVEIELGGKAYFPGKNMNWKTSVEGMKRLYELGRITAKDSSLQYRRFFSDFPVKQMSNLWVDSGGASNMVYVVQTNAKIVQRCMLMVTDPGDLVIDPTCGSGTTAFVAEQWGRRWVTIDTSRVAIQIARQRLMTASFDWYELAHPTEGVGSGFLYKKVPHVTLGDLGNAKSPKEETLVDNPKIDKTIVRVSGPFTVEAIPAISVSSIDKDPISDIGDSSIARSGETARQEDWRCELLKTGVRAKSGAKIEFARVELIQGTRRIHAEAETLDGKKVLVSFGPEYAPLEQTQVELCLEEAGMIKPAPEMILFAAFQFDPEASKDIDETQWAGVELLKVQMNTDLLTSDLKKNQSSSESFWLVGQPDVQVSTDNSGKFIVNVNGFDYYNPSNGEVQSGGKKEIAMWMLDTDYDGRSIFPTQVFFPMAGSKDGWNKLAKNLKAEIEVSLLEKFEGSESIPFEAGEYKRCAVKIIDNRGIESFCVKNLD
ncbi:MAG TPA: site-specific DNA-methyltransferase [Acidimicrobiia bacterium]|nr:site-specific DNA-methyltransferase [Acidimicrobiia bacterium]